MNRDLVKIRSLTPFPDALGRYTKITDGVGMRTIIRNPAADGELTTETLNTTGSDGFIELTNKTLKDVSGRVMNFESKADNLLISNQEYAYDAADGRLRGTGEGNTGVAAVYYRDENSEFVAHTVTYQGTMAEALAENPAKWRGYFGRHRDGEGRLANVQNYKVGQPITSGMHTFGYDALDRRTSEARDGGTNWEYGYNSRNEVTSASRKDDAGTALNGWQFAYSFDAIGNRYSSSGGRRTGTYTTNALNQYTAATVAGKIDVVGEVQTPDTLVWASRTVPPPNEGIQQTTETTRQGNWFHRAVPVSNTAGPVDTQILVKGIRTGQTNPTMEETGRVLLPKAAETFTYDADGNMTGDSLWIYTWDGENRLVEVVSKLPTDSGSYRKLRFKYDYANRMAKKEVSKWVGGAWVVEYRRHCIWQGWNIIGELDHLGGAPASSDTGSLRRTVWGLDLSGSLQGAGGVGGLLAVQPLVGAAQITTPVYDGNGNILAYHDLTTGVKVADFAYGPFGEPLKAYGPAAKNHPFRFSTKYTDEETGLVLYQLRPYRADLGRWLQKDRIGERGGVNLYGMVGNRPTTQIDMIGLCEIGDSQYVSATFVVEDAKGKALLPDLATAFQRLLDAIKDVAGVPGLPTQDFTDSDTWVAAIEGVLKKLDDGVATAVDDALNKFSLPFQGSVGQLISVLVVYKYKCCVERCPHNTFDETQEERVYIDNSHETSEIEGRPMYNITNIEFFKDLPEAILNASKTAVQRAIQKCKEGAEK